MAAALRLATAGQSLFGDELYLWWIVHGRSLGHVFSVVADTEKTPPLGFVLAWVSARGAHADVLVRAPSLVAGIATVPLVYLLGLRTVGRAAALVAAAWFALSPFELFYGTESRAYALATALVVASTLALLTALADGRRRWWALYALATAAAVYSHYTAALVLVPQGAWALWRHRDLARAQLIAAAAVVLAFLPWAPAFVVQFGNSGDEARRISEMVPFTAANVAKISGKALVGHPYVAYGRLPDAAALAALALVIVAALITLSLGRVRVRPPAADRGLLALLALAPPVLIVLYSARPHASFLLERNLAVAVPYALLLIGRLLTAPRPRAAAAALTLVALAALATGAVKMLDRDYQRPDARAAARYVDARAPATAPLVFWPGADAVNTFLTRPRPVAAVSQFAPGRWAELAHARRPVVLAAPDTPAVAALFRPPPPYRLTAEHREPGAPFALAIRSYEP